MSYSTFNELLFPALPLELREEIYRYLVFPTSKPRRRGGHKLHPHHVLVGMASSHGFHCYQLPSLCALNKPTYYEVGLFFIRNVEFRMLGYQGAINLTRLLDTFPGEQGFAAVRRLSFERWLAGHTAVRDVEEGVPLMKRCTGLSELGLRLTCSNLITTPMLYFQAMEDRETSEDHLMTLEEVVRRHRFEEILELRSLNKLFLDVFRFMRLAYFRDFFESVLIDCMPLMQELAEWLRRGFSARGMRVEVIVMESTDEGLSGFWSDRSTG
ncbi:hypothetical protein BDV95DRAFT_598157 [Massariosphaeria phaeospora]|uniref:F-box domain-containing protein n=1 Tax=Massariosphaeria phaeospora TaxID=100035 RepID=A0A7C8M4H8_9PLEO|nr:hypothetical protein BDV95DRAFT_598157 [Massariosphaeria phaeospora]